MEAERQKLLAVLGGLRGVVGQQESWLLARLGHLRRGLEEAKGWQGGGNRWVSQNPPPKIPIFIFFCTKIEPERLFSFLPPPGRRSCPQQVPGGLSPLGKKHRWEHGFETPFLGTNPLFWGTKLCCFGATKSSTLGQKSLYFGGTKPLWFWAIKSSILGGTQILYFGAQKSSTLGAQKQTKNLFWGTKKKKKKYFGAIKSSIFGHKTPLLWGRKKDSILGPQTWLLWGTKKPLFWGHKLLYFGGTKKIYFWVQNPSILGGHITLLFWRPKYLYFGVMKPSIFRP